MTIKELISQSYQTSWEHGFWDEHIVQPEKGKTNFISKTCIPEKLCLLHSEVSEALEAYREGQMTTTYTPSGKPEGFESELADIAIRLGDLCGAFGIDLEKVIEEKMAYNKTRPYKHGKKI
jgi:NTP pyrophosphatase (non-canonical NTP hydrolase)